MNRIDFLGTGNAFTPFGRLHALAVIDRKILIDTPPSLIPQLRESGIETSDISHLLFTHWHADHTFGFPFFLLERKYISDTKREQELNIYLRPGGKEFLSNLCKYFTPDLNKTPTPISKLAGDKKFFSCTILDPLPINSPDGADFDTLFGYV